ncbi:MAG: EutN/CcmL family microcompartment protein [Thermoguttaceae bacterium]
MVTGKVIGNATSTVKHPSMEGWKLLVVQPLASDGRSPDGEPVLAVDRLGAGRRDRVIISSDGKSTRELIGHMATPVRWAVIGIQDD